MGDKRKMKLSGELDYRIRYDVEHNLFHVKNVFNDEYITPTFVEYVQKLEKENAELKEIINNDVDKKIYVQLAKKAGLADVQKDQLTNAKELLKKVVGSFYYLCEINNFSTNYECLVEAEQFLNGEGCPDCFCEDCTKEDCGIKKLGLVEVEK